MDLNGQWFGRVYYFNIFLTVEITFVATIFPVALRQGQDVYKNFPSSNLQDPWSFNNDRFKISDLEMPEIAYNKILRDKNWYFSSRWRTIKSFRLIHTRESSSSDMTLELSYGRCLSYEWPLYTVARAFSKLLTII